MKCSVLAVAHKLKKLENVAEVTRWRLCAGCGACASACPQGAIRMVDIQVEGLRPIVDSARCIQCHRCVRVCPGLLLSVGPVGGKTLSEFRCSWGPVLEVWEGYATDRAIRYKGASGGVVTALSCFCLSELGMAGVLHVGSEEGNPLVNVPVFSTNRADLLCRVSSRYSPAAPCEGVNLVKAADSERVFVGKPCDVAGLRDLQSVNKGLIDKFGLVISLFCAGTPVIKGKEEVLQRLDIKPTEVVELKYRGEGWPGKFRVKLKGEGKVWREMSYEEYWGGILSGHIPLRCELCPDSTGGLADISCGDAWHRPINTGRSGWSLVLVRTEKGRDVLHRAMDAGYINMFEGNLNTLRASQRSLLDKRRSIWGKLFAMRLTGVPQPDLQGFSLFANWCDFSLFKKVHSFGGMIRRVVRKRLTQPTHVLSKTRADNLSHSRKDTAARKVERE